MNLDDLLNEMSEKIRNRDLSDEYLIEHNNSTREEIGIGEYAYGITMIPCEWVYEYLSDYKRVLKENEELKEYKKIAELTKISCCTAQNCEALNNAIKSELENQKLKEELNDINQKWIQKVKDKIEEYKNMLKTCNKVKDIDRIKAINERILELEELLEGRK